MSHTSILYPGESGCAVHVRPIFAYQLQFLYLKQNTTRSLFFIGAITLYSEEEEKHVAQKIR